MTARRYLKTRLLKVWLPESFSIAELFSTEPISA